MRQQGWEPRGNAHHLWPLVCAAVVLGAAGCDCAPARSKPWRHAPEPTADTVPSAAETANLVDPRDRVENRARRAHTLRIHVDADPLHLHPLAAPTVWTQRIVHGTVFETLIRYVPPEGGAGNGPGRYVPHLARSWRVAPSGREIRIELEPDVTFHDGRRMTAVDVQFSIDSARHPRVPAYHLRRALADVTAVEILGPTSVRVRLARPNGYVLRALASVPILSEHVYERRLQPRRGPVVGTGPYALASWDEGVVHLHRTDDYWGEAPAIADVEFVVEPDAAAALTAAKRGEIDIVPALIPEHHPEQAAAPGFASFAPLRLAPPALRYVVMNTRAPPFDDWRVRKAIALLIDRDEIADEIYDGLARPAPGPVWPGGPGDGAAPAAPAYDPAAAATLLDAAGWRDTDGDGIRERDGRRFVVSVLATDDESPERDIVRESLRRSGIVTTVRVGTTAVLEKRLAQADFELAFAVWRGPVDRDLAPVLESGGSVNHGRYSSRRADGILGEIRAVWEPASRAPLLGELARLFAQEWPIVPLVRPDPYGLVHERVRGIDVWNGWFSIPDLSLAPD